MNEVCYEKLMENAGKNQAKYFHLAALVLAATQQRLGNKFMVRRTFC